MTDLSGAKLGEFVLHERISDDVYHGEQRPLGRGVVVKVFHQRHGAAAMQRLICRAQLDHHYAVHIYNFGVDQERGMTWVAMEMVPGVSIKYWLQAHGPIALEVFVPFFECIAHVVQAAHDRGIVHGHLKPSNVMVVDSGGDLLPKLLGLGIDRLTSGHAGRAAYMAPEQWSNAKSAHPTGSAVDIYALGVIAYETLTGRVPFIATTPDEYGQRHRNSPMPALGDGFSPDLDRILQRALAKAPEDRHRSALELASELRVALRTSQPQQIRSAAQRWDDGGRLPGLLWRGKLLADLKGDGAPAGVGDLGCSFVAESQRLARSARRASGAIITIATIVVFCMFLYHHVMQARSDQQRAEVTTTQAELEQGRQALLHKEPDAQAHLAEAYKRDPSPTTAFMYARSLQPRLAELMRFASSAGRMWSVTFSPDSRQLVMTDDQCAQVRDAQTGRLLFTMSHGDTVYQALYSASGTRLITAGGDGSVRIWDAATGALVRALVHDGQKLRYFAVAASPDGKLMAAIDRKGQMAHVWDAATGSPLAELRNDASEFPSLAFSADGHWLATSGGNDVRVFDTHTWTQAKVLPGPGVHGLSWDPTGPHLLTGTTRGDVSIWNIPSGERIRHLRELGEPVDAVAFSPSGELVVAAGRDGAEQVWSAVSGTLQSQGNYLHGKIRSVEFDPTSKLIVAAGSSGAVAVADATLGMPITVLDGPRNIVWVAHFDPSSRRVVGASWDGTARVWDAASPYLRWSSPPLSDDCGLVTAPEPDRRFIAVGCRNHKTRVWDTAHDQLLAELPSVTPVDGDFGSAFPAVSAVGDRAAIARGNAVEIYEIPGERLLRTVVHPAAVSTVAFASTGNDLVSGAIDGSLLVTRDGQEPQALPGFPDGIDVAAFLPDGRIVAAAASKRLRVYNPGGAVAELEIPDRVMSLRASPESHRLVTLPSNISKAVPPMLLDLERYCVIAPLEGHIGWVFSARFEAGQIVTAGADGTVRRWNVVSGQLLQTYRGGSRFLADATLAPDGSTIIAGDGDGLLRFWDAATARPLWTLPAHKSHVIGLHFEGTAIVTRGFSGDVSRWVLPRPEQVIQACSDREAALSWPNGVVVTTTETRPR